jgi:hypothetical protein
LVDHAKTDKDHQLEVKAVLYPMRIELFKSSAKSCKLKSLSKPVTTSPWMVSCFPCV